MAYFTAVLTSTDDDWQAHAVDLPTGSAEEVGDVLRSTVDDDSVAVLAFLEREDEWFAVVRADPDGDVRIFVSDAVAATGSRYADLFAELPPALPTSAPTVADDEEAEADVELDDAGDVEDEPPTRAADNAEPAVAVVDLWAGDAELLTDLGCAADVLILTATEAGDPAVATTDIAEQLGAGEVLESLR